MKADRIAIYGHGFPKGFQSLNDAKRILAENLIKGLPKSFHPRAPKDGEHLIIVRADPNGVQYERGDVILGMQVESAAFPELPQDWKVLQARPTFKLGNDCQSSYFRYLLVFPLRAEDEDVAACRAAAKQRSAKTMDWAMNS